MICNEVVSILQFTNPKLILICYYHRFPVGSTITFIFSNFYPVLLIKPSSGLNRTFTQMLITAGPTLMNIASIPELVHDFSHFFIDYALEVRGRKDNACSGLSAHFPNLNRYEIAWYIKAKLPSLY
jgi:hypothetical protein